MSNDLKREAARFRQRKRRERRAGGKEMVTVEVSPALQRVLAEYGFIEKTDHRPMKRAVEVALDFLARGELVPTTHALAFRRNDLRNSKLARGKFDTKYEGGELDTFRNPLGRRPFDSEPEPAEDLEPNRADPELPTDPERPFKNIG